MKGNNTIDNKNSIYVSIVLGATSPTTNAYQPNPVYIKEGQTIIWINGSSLILSANDTEIIDAIHQFMEFQAREHHGH